MVWALIAVGGAVGALARHALNAIIQQRVAGAFPLGIFLVNVSACLAIGLLAGLMASSRIGLGEQSRSFLIVGVLGGFTTFLTFGLDTFVLARGGQGLLALGNALGQVVVGLAMVWCGYAVGSWRG